MAQFRMALFMLAVTAALAEVCPDGQETCLKGSSMLATKAHVRPDRRVQEDPADATAAEAEPVEAFDGDAKVEEFKTRATEQGDEASVQKQQSSTMDDEQKNAETAGDNADLKALAAEKVRTMHVQGEAYFREAAKLAKDASELRTRAIRQDDSLGNATAEFETMKADELAAQAAAADARKEEKQQAVETEAMKDIAEKKKEIMEEAQASLVEATANKKAAEDELKLALRAKEEKEAASTKANTIYNTAKAAWSKATADTRQATKELSDGMDIRTSDEVAFGEAKADTAGAAVEEEEAERLRQEASTDYNIKRESAHRATEKATKEEETADAAEQVAVAMAAKASGLAAKVMEIPRASNSTQ